MKTRPLARGKNLKSVAAFFCAALALLMLTGCPEGIRGIDIPNIQKAISEGREIRLSDFILFRWQRVFIYAPYTSQDQIKKETGTAVPFPGSDSEGHCLLAFIDEGKVVKSLEVKRSEADFSALQRKGGYNVDEAVFKAVTLSSGRKQLKKTTEP